MSITFIRQPRHGQRHPTLPRLSYIDLLVDDGVERITGITGYVTPATAALVEATPAMLAKLKEIAKECSTCRGSPVREFDDGTRPCTDCKDITDVIDAAEGKQ